LVCESANFVRVSFRWQPLRQCTVFVRGGGGGRKRDFLSVYVGTYDILCFWFWV
jgi:hypothetical protein